jgi:hypothetical protein
MVLRTYFLSIVITFRSQMVRSKAHTQRVRKEFFVPPQMVRSKAAHPKGAKRVFRAASSTAAWILMRVALSHQGEDG